MGSRQVEIDFKFRPSEPLPRPDFETATTTTRISKFEPSAARLYFIFRSHFLMPWIWKKQWFYDGRMYGSTIFHQAPRKTKYLHQRGGIFKKGWGREISTCEESKNSQRMSKPSPCRNVPDGSDISMFSAAVCVGASTIATGD